jgi:hypothetical protein
VGVPADAKMVRDVRPVEAKLDIGEPTPNKNTGNKGLGELEDYARAVVRAHETEDTKRQRSGLKGTTPAFIPCMLYDALTSGC